MHHPVPGPLWDGTRPDKPTLGGWPDQLTTWGLIADTWHLRAWRPLHSTVTRLHTASALHTRSIARSDVGGAVAGCGRLARLLARERKNALGSLAGAGFRLNARGRLALGVNLWVAWSWTSRQAPLRCMRRVEPVT